MFFAVIMIALAFGAVALVGHVAGWLGALAFAAILFGAYRLLTYESGRARAQDRSQLNAFQRPLSDD